MTTPTIAKLHRTTQAYCNQLCAKETLDHGIAYYCPRFPDAAEVNHFCEVVAPDQQTCQIAFAQANAWFDLQKLTCLRSTTAWNQPEQAWATLLADRGFTERRYTAMALSGWTDHPMDPAVRVLPARAMRVALRETVVTARNPAARAAQGLEADLLNERLDDAAFDLYVAVVGGKPAGRCALFQVGDIARVMEFSVQPPWADTGVAATLLATALALAKRLNMQSVCARSDAADEAQRAIFARFGFVEDGAFVEMERAASPATGGAVS